MAGKIVKTKSGKIGKTQNEDPPYLQEVFDNSIVHMEKVAKIWKIKVFLDDGTKMICSLNSLEVIGYWD